MSRFIDDIRSHGKLEAPPWISPAKHAAWIKHMERCTTILFDEQLPVILADNVARYYFEGTGKERWDVIRDFPNVAPPYPVAWFEHRFPKEIVSDEYGRNTKVHDLAPNGRVGWILIGANREDAKGIGIPEEARWILAAEQFIDYGTGRYYGTPGTIVIAADRDGRILGAPSMQSFADERYSGMMRYIMTWLHPILLTLSFMNCRNVTVVDNEVPEKLAKKYFKRHGLKPTRYKTLIIEPLKEILRKQGRSGEVGLAKSLHICRGHFKDYRERGLFGKHHAVVWFDQSVRGTKGDKAPPREVEVKV